MSMQDKRDSVSTTMRSRRVFYDDYTNGFYVESRLETLQRQVDTRGNLTDVLNKSQEARCDYRKRQVDAAKRIFVRKNALAMTTHKDNLHEYKAHYTVLQEMARKKAKEGYFQEHLGRYGPGSSKYELQDLIENKIRQSAPSAKRRRDARKHLNNRVKMELFDRKLPTSDLLKAKVKSRASTKDGSHRSHLILPPLAVKFTKKNGAEIGSGVHIATRPATGGRYDDLNLPSVFVTQSHKVG